MSAWYDGICFAQDFCSHTSAFHGFQQTKIKPVNLVKPVKKQYSTSCQKTQVYNL